MLSLQRSELGCNGLGHTAVEDAIGTKLERVLKRWRTKRRVDK